MTGIYRLADRNIEISSIHRSVHDLCRDYRLDSCSCVPDFTVCITPADIEYERLKSAKDHSDQDIPEPYFPDFYLEELAVYRKIAETLPDYDSFLFHGSAIAVDGEGFLFTAKSGTGKSTHTRLWRELLGSKALMVNDDKPLIRITDSGTVVYGTPWDGKHHLSRNICVPLRAICILERGETNHIREIDKAEALPFLLQQAYRPSDPAGLKKTLTLLDRLQVRFYRLQCNMEIGAAELAWRVMRRQ